MCALLACDCLFVCMPFKDLCNAVALSHWFNSRDCQGQNDKTDWSTQFTHREICSSTEWMITTPIWRYRHPACTHSSWTSGGGAERGEAETDIRIKIKTQSKQKTLSVLMKTWCGVSVCNVWLIERQGRVSFGPCIYFCAILSLSRHPTHTA